MTSKRYTMAKWFVITNYFCIVIAFLFVVLFVFNIIQAWKSGSILGVMEFLLGLTLFGGCGVYSVMILPRMKESICIDDQKITHEHADGTTTTINWKEPFQIIERPILARVDLISMDNTRVIKIEQQVKDFKELMDFIWKKQSAISK